MASTHLHQGSLRGGTFPDLWAGSQPASPTFTSSLLSSGTSHQKSPFQGTRKVTFRAQLPLACVDSPPGLELENSAEEKQQVDWQVQGRGRWWEGAPRVWGGGESTPRWAGDPSLTHLTRVLSVGHQLPASLSQSRSLNFTFSFLSEASLEGSGRSKGRSGS